MKLLQYELEPLSEEKITKVAEIGDFLQVSDFLSRLTTYLIQEGLHLSSRFQTLIIGRKGF